MLYISGLDSKCCIIQLDGGGFLHQVIDDETNEPGYEIVYSRDAASEFDTFELAQHYMLRVGCSCGTIVDGMKGD